LRARTCLDARCAGTCARPARWRAVLSSLSVWPFVSLLSLKRDSHLRTNHDRIRNITCAAGIDHILQVRLNVTPLRHLKSMSDFQHLFGIGEVTAGDMNAAGEVITDMAVNKMQHGAVVVAPGKQAFVVD